LGTKAFQEGVDLAKLAADYQAITGRTFPAPVPGPTPTPTPGSDPLHDLAGILRQFISSVEAWLKAHNL
jgi:hypothetical protein